MTINFLSNCTKTAKQKLRTHFMRPYTIDKYSEACVRQKTKKLLAQLQPKIISIYWPIHNEFNLLPTISTWLAENPDCTACLPVIVKNNRCLKFAPWKPGMRMQRGIFNIPIPYKHQETQIPELLFIPCVAFDQDKFRLGYGGGYYDATIINLKKNKNNILTIGVALEKSRVICLPREQYDQALNYIISDANTEISTIKTI